MSDLFDEPREVAEADDDGVVLLEWGVVPNDRVDGDGQPMGWLPMVWHNGRKRLGSYATRGLDRSAALAEAKHEAKDEASRYIGDWNVTVRKRQAP